MALAFDLDTERADRAAADADQADKAFGILATHLERLDSRVAARHARKYQRRLAAIEAVSR